MEGPEALPPQEIDLSDIGINLSPKDMLRFTNWAMATALFKSTQHNVHNTTRDARPYSYIRKIPIPFDVRSELPAEYVNITHEIYSGIYPLYASYLRADLSELPTRYAAEVHVRKNGDGKGEGHVDYYPSCNVYFSNSKGGELVASRNPEAKTTADIAEDAYHI